MWNARSFKSAPGQVRLAADDTLSTRAALVARAARARVAPEIPCCDAESVARRAEKSPPLVIYASVDRSGTTYSLSERTRHVIREKFGDAVRVHSRIFVSDETSADHEQLRGPMREQVIQLLTGLSESRLKELGVVEFRNPASDEAVA